MTATNKSSFSHKNQTKDWQIPQTLMMQQRLDQLEQENLILLKEIKAKDKQIQDIKSVHQQELLDLQNQLKADRLQSEIRAASLEENYSSQLEMQQEKYNRRLSRSHGSENNDFNNALTRKKPKNGFHVPISSFLSADKLQQRSIHELSDRLTEMSLKHASHIESLKQDHQKELRELKAQYEDQSVYHTVVEELQQKLKDTHQLHQTRIKELYESQHQNKERLKELFMSENAQLTMHYQARVDNLTTEYQQNLSDLTDSLENEKHVLTIEHKTNLDQLEKELKDRARQLTEMHSNFIKTKRELRQLSQSFNQIKKEQARAKHLARDLLSFSVHSTEDLSNQSLLDILGRVLTTLARKETLQDDYYNRITL